MTPHDLDSVLDSFDPETRARLRRLLANGSRSLEGVTPQANRTLHYLDPALGETTALTSEIARDQLAFQRLRHTWFTPRINPKFRLRRDDKFYAIGSCFARGLETYLEAAPWHNANLHVSYTYTNSDRFVKGRGLQPEYVIPRHLLGFNLTQR